MQSTAQTRGDLPLADAELFDEAERWLHENREAIAYYNRRVAEQGVLSGDASLLVRS